MNALIFALLTAALPTGSAYIASTGGTCPSSAVATTSCRLASVSCKNLWDPDGRRAFSIDDLSASLKVTDPSGTAVGTVIMQIGGGGTSSGEANTQGITAISGLVTAGWRVVQVMWGTGSGNGMWGGSPSSSSYGGDSSPDGPLDLACRSASLSRAICDDSTLRTAGTPCVWYGQSGGCSAGAYALTRYGGGDWLDGLVCSGGPPIGLLERGCAGTTYPSWTATDCPPLKTVSPSGGCSYTNSATSGQFTDGTWNDGRTGCATQSAPNVAGSQGLGYSGLFGQGAVRRFPYTVIRGLYGDADSSEAVPLGRAALNMMRDAANAAPVQLVTTGSTPHSVLETTDGAAGVDALVAGGSYHSTTYAAITRTRPALANTWTPEAIPHVELWLHTHALPHLWVEDYGTQALTHPAVDGDLVRVITEPVHAHEIGGATTSGTVLSSGSGASSYIRFTRADSDWMTIKDTGTTALAFIHQKAVFSILMHLGVGSDGTAQTILDNAVATTSNSGFQVVRTSGNKLQVQVMRSSAGTSTFNCTTTASLVAADGIVPITIVAGGNSANTGQLRIKIGSNAEETCAQSNAPASSTSPGQVLWIGRASGGGQACDCLIQDLAIVDGVVNSDDLAAWRAWNPARTSSSLVRFVGPNAGWFNFLSRDYDYTLTDNLYTDTAGTTHVVAAGDAIALVRSGSSPDGHLGRSGSQSTAANRPLWRGTTGAEWDGSNDELTITQTADHGASTWLLVGTNDDTTNGTHFFGSGGRILVTGTSYSGNSPAQAPSHADGHCYATTHPGTGGTCLSDLLSCSPGAANALEVHRDGASWTQGVLQLSAGAASLVNQCTATNTAQMHFTHMGTPAIGAWDLDGYTRRATEWAADVTGHERWPDVRAYYCARYGGC